MASEPKPEGEKPKKLDSAQQAFVVQCLACFDGPSLVVKSVKERFGITITPQAIEAYHPDRHAGRNLAKKWVDLFRETRKTFLEDTSEIAISHRAVRLRALNRMAEKAEAQGNFVLAKELHKQAAEEVGNVYSNRRELTGKDGKDLPVAPATVTVYELPSNGR